LRGRHEVARLDGTALVVRVGVSSHTHHLIRRPLVVINNRDAHADGVPTVEKLSRKGLIVHADPGSIGMIVLQDFAAQADGDA
jgi:hypothetical protein